MERPWLELLKVAALAASGAAVYWLAQRLDGTFLGMILFRGGVMEQNIFPLLVPVLSWAGTGIVKKFFERFGTKIPSWVKPLLSAVLGAVINSLGAAAGTGTVTYVDPAMGFMLGGGAPLFHETKKRARGDA